MTLAGRDMDAQQAEASGSSMTRSSSLHKLLERQVRRHFGASPPPGLEEFLASVSRSYEEADADRQLVERSLELTSQELLERNAALREREREQQTIFDSVPAMIFYKDTENRILRLNTAAAQMLGQPAEALQGMSIDDVFPPAVARAKHDDDLEVIRSNRPKLGIVEALPGADGRTHWVRTDKVPYRDDQGNVKGVIVLSVDITERKEAEEAMRASEERYRLIVETATEGIWTIDQQGLTMWCNPVMAEWLGYTVEEMAGRSVFDFMAASELPRAQQELGALMSGGRVSLDFRFQRKDGSDLWVQASAAAMLDRAGAVVGALGMMTDITERKASEAKLQDAYERLQKVDKERMQFINNAAHELGTPLTPIRLQLHLLKAQAVVPEVAKPVAILERNFDRLSHLVQDLLDSARLQAATLNLKVERVDLTEVLRQATETYAAPAAASGVLLQVEDLPPLAVVADRSRLGQVFDNLLSNALKFTAAGRHVRVAAKERGGFVYVTVRDEGTGIAPTDLKRLFQPFTQVHDTMQTTRGGTGLGLYVCRGIMDALGGGIAADSAGLGKGSTFTVQIPLAPPGDPPVPPAPGTPALRHA